MLIQKENNNFCFFKIFAFILIIITFIIIYNKKSNENSDNSNSLDNPDHSDVPDDLDIAYIREINCIYSIDTANNTMIILGKEFSKNSNFDLIIDGEIVNFTKEYKFSIIGEHKITFGLLEYI